MVMKHKVAGARLNGCISTAEFERVHVDVITLGFPNS